MLAKLIAELSLEKELEIRTSAGRLTRNGVKLQDDDVILRPRQRRLLRG